MVFHLLHNNANLNYHIDHCPNCFLVCCHQPIHLYKGFHPLLRDNRPPYNPYIKLRHSWIYNIFRLFEQHNLSSLPHPAYNNNFSQLKPILFSGLVSDIHFHPQYNICHFVRKHLMLSSFHYVENNNPCHLHYRFQTHMPVLHLQNSTMHIHLTYLVLPPIYLHKDFHFRLHNKNSKHRPLP